MKNVGGIGLKCKIHCLEKKVHSEVDSHRKHRGSALTSSTGNSLSFGKELDSSPTRKGVGQQTISNIDPGSTGMKVCCQEKGQSSATTACMQLDRVLMTGETKNRKKDTHHQSPSHNNTLQRPHQIKLSTVKTGQMFHQIMKNFFFHTERGVVVYVVTTFS